MRGIRFVLSLIFLSFLCSLVSAQIVETKAGYLIYVKYQKDQVIKQTISMQLDGKGNQKSSTQFTTKCLSVEKNGNSNLEVSVSTGGKVQGNKKKFKLDKHGKPLGSSIDGYSGTFAWPDKPTKLGQSWSGNITMAGAGTGAGGSIKSTYKFAGVKTINGVKVASIAAMLSVGGNFDITGTGMIYVRFSDGQLHSADFNLGLKQYSETNTPSRIKLTMTMRTML